MNALRPYLKAAVAFAALLATGLVLVAVGATDAGVAMIGSAPVVSGLVATVRNR